MKGNHVAAVFLFKSMKQWPKPIQVVPKSQKNVHKAEKKKKIVKRFRSFLTTGMIVKYVGFGNNLITKKKGIAFIIVYCIYVTALVV